MHNLNPDAFQRTQEKMDTVDGEYEAALERANLMMVEAEMARIELRQIFNMAADGMWVLDEDFNINRINHAMLEMLGQPEENILGKK